MVRTAADESKLLAEKWPISVVIPAYNAAVSLPACLGAIAKNDLSNTELLLADDSSSDDSGAIARSYGFRCVRTPRRLGPAGTRNFGLENSRFPHLLFVDADVVLPAKALFWIRETLDLYSHRDDVAGALGQYAEDIPSTGFFSQFKNLSTCYLYRLTDTQSPFLHTAILCVRRSLLEEVGGFDASLRRGEDFRLGLSLGSRGYRFVIDRRVEGVHLKEYSFAETLREDWRRVRDLAAVRLSSTERRFSLGAHRWNRLLSVTLPAVILGCAGMGFWAWQFGWIAIALLLTFFALNLGFLWYCAKLRGLWFALRAALFLPLEMAWAQLALAAAALMRPAKWGRTRVTLKSK